MTDQVIASEILRSFRDIGEHLQAPAEFDDRMNYLVEATAQLLRSDRCALFVFDGDAYIPKFGFGYGPEVIKKFSAVRIPAGAAMLATVKESGGLAVVNEAWNHPQFAQIAKTVDFESIAIATIDDFDGRPLGLMTAELVGLFVEFVDLAGEVLAASAVLARGVAVRERTRRQEQQVNDERRLMMDRVVDAENRERRRIGTDLHDVVLQRVASLAHFLEMAAQQEPEGDPKRVTLERLQREAQESAIELRRLVTDLAPLGSETLSLRSVLEGLVAGRRGVTGPSTSLRVGSDGDPPEPVRTALHRIARQGVDNALSHANAKSIEVAYDVRSNGTSMQIRDDGVGFSVSGVPAGVGLFSMAQRAQHLGGRCDISSTPGEGTVVDAWIPHVQD